MRANEADLVASLPGVLAAGFKAKGWKDKVVGAGWSGIPKEIQPEGLLVGDKVRSFSDEGLGWFYELFYEKTGERYALSAKEHEALAVLAEAACLLEGGKAGDASLAEWDRAAAADPARADHLKARRALTQAEHDVRALLDESDALHKQAVDELDALEKQLNLPDAKKSAEARTGILAAEAGIREKLAKARTKVLEVARDHAGTLSSRPALREPARDGTLRGGDGPRAAALAPGPAGRTRRCAGAARAAAGDARRPGPVAAPTPPGLPPTPAPTPPTEPGMAEPGMNGELGGMGTPAPGAGEPLPGAPPPGMK